jgi:2-oxoglutarate dehydrogenase E2 component (dihydrolipoamide succinyltransferase)
MTMEIRVPNLPESVADAILVAWRKQPGEAVSRDENLADLETDKVVLEVPAPANGVISKLHVKTGATVKSGDLLAEVDENASAAAPKPAAAPADASRTLAASASAAAAAAGSGDAVRADAVRVEAVRAEAVRAEKEKLSPAVRRLVEENRLDPSQIAASGRDGRLTKSDVVSHLTKPAAAVAPAAGPIAAAAAPAIVSGRSEQRVPMTRLRQRIAERLVQAQHGAAMLTTFNEVDLSAVSALRARYKDRFEKEHGAKLGFMSFFVKASIEALKKFPVVNASVDGTDIVYHEYYDIGVAVSTDRGLVVPVVRDADLKTFAKLEKEIVDYGTRARSGGLKLEELTGGTFTITNGGVFGSMMSTPILNAPQSAILGMHKIQDRAVVVDGQVVVRPMMYLAMSYDHRIIDGREAVQTLVTIKECLEDPGRMLIGL